MLISKKNKILIVGYGVSGQSAYKYLVSNGYRVYVYDNEKTNAPNYCDDISVIDVVVKSPSVKTMPHNAHAIICNARSIGIPVISTLDLFYNAISGPNNSRIIAITGTNGKSTISSMVYHIMRGSGYDVSLGGNIGIPYFDMPLSEYYVLELSSYELESSCLVRCDVGAITNIAEDHIDFHGTFDNYIDAKHKLLRISSKGIISASDNITCDKYTGKENIISVKFNSNADFAIGISREIGIEENVAIQCLSDFEGLPHRAQTIASRCGITFVNDSKATNPHASSNALKELDGEIYWLVGGRSKNVDPRPFVSQYMRGVRRIYCFGESRDEMYDYFCDNFVCHKYLDMESGVYAAYSDALKSNCDHKIILLSPMCASFDEFNSFEERGVSFINIVSGLLKVDGESI